MIAIGFSRNEEVFSEKRTSDHRLSVSRRTDSDAILAESDQLSKIARKEGIQENEGRGFSIQLSLEVTAGFQRSPPHAAQLFGPSSSSVATPSSSTVSIPVFIEIIRS